MKLKWTLKCLKLMDYMCSIKYIDPQLYCSTGRLYLWHYWKKKDVNNSILTKIKKTNEILRQRWAHDDDVHVMLWLRGQGGQKCHVFSAGVRGVKLLICRNSCFLCRPRPSLTWCPCRAELLTTTPFFSPTDSTALAVDTKATANTCAR